MGAKKRKLRYYDDVVFWGNILVKILDNIEFLKIRSFEGRIGFFQIIFDHIIESVSKYNLYIFSDRYCITLTQIIIRVVINTASQYLHYHYIFVDSF